MDIVSNQPFVNNCEHRNVSFNQNLYKYYTNKFATSGNQCYISVILFEHVTGHLGNSVENVASG